MKKFAMIFAAGTMALGLSACDVDQTEEGSLPEIEGGNMPEYDVEAPDVDVGTEERVVEVPTLDVDTQDAEGVPATAPSE